MTKLITTIIFLISVVSVQADSSFNCLFERHYSAHIDQDKTERYIKDPTKLAFINNKTTESTLKLDGNSRATNSTEWNLVASNNLGAKYIGTHGDLLTIMYKPDAEKGTYKATLQWASLGYAFSSIGSCTGKP